MSSWVGSGTALEQANDSLGLLKQIAIVLTKHVKVPVGKPGDKVALEFSARAWDEDGPWRVFNMAYEHCFQKGPWCLEPKDNITQGPHGMMLVISTIQFFLNAPGMEQFLPLMVERIDTLVMLVNDV